MCLFISRRAKQQIAKEDIHVFKILSIALVYGLVTPYQWMQVPTDGVLIPEGFVEGQDIPVDKTAEANSSTMDINLEVMYRIHGGAIHGYISKDEAVVDSDYDEIVAIGIIPKGTKYYVSYDGKQFAAQKVMLTLKS